MFAKYSPVASTCSSLVPESYNLLVACWHPGVPVFSVILSWKKVFQLKSHHVQDPWVGQHAQSWILPKSFGSSDGKQRVLSDIHRPWGCIIKLVIHLGSIKGKLFKNFRPTKQLYSFQAGWEFRSIRRDAYSSYLPALTLSQIFIIWELRFLWLDSSLR